MATMYTESFLQWVGAIIKLQNILLAVFFITHIFYVTTTAFTFNDLLIFLPLTMAPTNNSKDQELFKNNRCSSLGKYLMKLDVNHLPGSNNF